MNYKKNTIKNGIELHTIETPKFKTNLFAIFLTTPLNRANITKNALIIAARHIHSNYEDAKKYGFIDKECVSLKIYGQRPGVLEKVYVRLDDSFSLEVHIDTDEANAFLIKNGDQGNLIIE